MRAIRMRRTRLWTACWLVLLGGLAAPPEAVAQGDGVETVEVDALQCWRRVGRNAVHVGERFDMMLTCSIVETDAARTVPDLAWLEPETLTVSPFEVLEGERYSDIVRGARRFFQYRYALRIIGEDYFGLDVELPALEVKYRIERTLAGGAAVEGRELTYILPPESVRVLALVPAGVQDIRELPGETFGDVEARLFRANASSLAATVLGLVALGVLLVGAVRARRDWRGAAAVAQPAVSDWRVAHAALGELEAVRDAAGAGGWNAPLVGRALGSLRVAAALALERPVAQLAVTGGTASDADRDGRLRVPRWLFGSVEAFVSSPITPARIDAELTRRGHARPDDAAALAAIREGIAVFGAARYGAAGGEPPADTLAGPLDAGIAVLRALRVGTLPPVRFITRRRRTLREKVARLWPA